MNARDIQRRLVQERYREAFILHNYTPAAWWECDVFEVTKAGFFREYEVKLTAKDFRADAAKEHKKVSYEKVPAEAGFGRPRYERRETSLGTKHDMLGDPRRAIASKFNPPVQFWYVVPESLRQAVEPLLPPFAGLILAHPFATDGDPHGVRLSDARPAPRLHNEKLDAAVLENARGVCYYRMHSLFTRGRMLHERDVA